MAQIYLDTSSQLVSNFPRSVQFSPYDRRLTSHSHNFYTLFQKSSAKNQKLDFSETKSQITLILQIHIHPS